jgi:hypothetical protein
VDGDGEKYRPLQDKEITSEVASFLESLRPSMASMAGAFGEGCHFFMFPARSSDGGRIADPRESGNFSVRVGDRSFSWRLPLGSVLPPKRCPVDGQMLNGAWDYCPWHGERLEGEAGEPAPEVPPAEG